MSTDANGNIHDVAGKFAGHDRSAPEAGLATTAESPAGVRYRQAAAEFWEQQLPAMLEARSRAQDAQLDLARAEAVMLNPKAVQMRFAWRDDDRLGFPDEIYDAEGEPLDITLDTELDLFDDYDEARSRFFLDEEGRFIIPIEQ
ncbi:MULTISPECIES: hypothetical protein [unclassified Microbacterium]|uniref:hypothetical protein n=1 Tax=unclassified Microbacterium TaxID=2609290 RepID=UPI0010F5A9C5|nr:MULTISPECIES: hypothetical protein [unclassified Microbacterium]